MGNTVVRPDKTRLTGNKQTENTGINTLGIMRKMGDTWRGVKTSTKTCETDHGVTPMIFSKKGLPIEHSMPVLESPSDVKSCSGDFGLIHVNARSLTLKMYFIITLASLTNI